MSAREPMWTGYLDATMFTPARAVVLFAPPLALAVAAVAGQELTWVQVLLLSWAWTHLVDAVLILRRPAEFGLRLWFPPLAERGARGDETALALARTTAMFDLMFGAVRGALGLVPTSAPLVGLVLVTVVLQFAIFVRERRAGTTDQRAATIGIGGAVIVGGVVVLHAALGGVR